MINIIGVKFQQNGKIYYYDADGFDPHNGDYLIVETSKGFDLGEVILGKQQMDENLIKSPLKKIIRVANEQDLQRAADNRKKEKEAYDICLKKITEHKLDMKLVSVECSFDNSKILFYFTANDRVDFRALVRDLAGVFKTRIELRQIGVRDEAKMLGGLGPCGRPICCGSFLNDFQPVSIKMAKEQNLSLNPTKISGVCGRLMCCLKYEQDHYEKTRKMMPKIGKEAITPDGAGTVTELNILKETVKVRITRGDESEIKEYPLEQISKPAGRNENESSIRTGKDTHEEKTEYETDCSENQQSDKKSDDISEEIIKKDHGNSAKMTKRKLKPGKTKKAAVEGKKQISNGEQILGKPVMRENLSKNKHDTKNITDEKNQESINNTSSKKPNTWADALEKAMKAADDL